MDENHNKIENCKKCNCDRTKLVNRSVNESVERNRKVKQKAVKTTTKVPGNEKKPEKEKKTKITENEKKKELKKTANNDKKSQRSYKVGQYFLVALAFISIPIDGYKLVDNFIKAETYVSISKLDSSTYYLATLSTHITGFMAALDDQLWLTVFARFIATFVYQFELTRKDNETIPQEPEKLRKYVDKKMFQKKGNTKAQRDPDDDLLKILFDIFRYSLVTF